MSKLCQLWKALQDYGAIKEHDQIISNSQGVLAGQKIPSLDLTRDKNGKRNKA